MKRFRFNLTAVRQLRELQEEKAQKAHGDAMRQRNEAAQRLNDADNNLKRTHEALRSRMGPGGRGIPASELHQAQGWFAVLQERRKQLVADLEQQQRILEQRHGELKLAMRRREAMDRVFHKQLTAHRRAVESEEQKQLDELAARARSEFAPAMNFP